MIFNVKKINIFKIFAIILLVTILTSSFNFNYAVIYKPNLPISYIDEIFPESYKPYINELKKNHPNWIFKAVHTGLDWTESIKHESYEIKEGISTVHKSYGPEWKRNGVDTYIDGPYVVASKSAVAYVLDPRNFLNDTGIFQFEVLSYSNNITEANYLSSVEKLLASTPMGADQFKYSYKNNNEWIVMSKTYAQIIVEVGKKYGVSPIHIASRIIQETAGDVINNLSINGSYEGFTGIYNFFNAGATPDANGNNAIRNGLIYSQSKGWTTPELSIDGGVDLLKNNYIKWGQDTIYFQKFDVNNPGQASHLYGSQYMTNILAPKSESLTTYNAYNNLKMLENTVFEFHIPVYENMPTNSAPYPTSESVGYYEDDNTIIYLDDPSDTGVDDVFKVRSSPDDSNNSNIIAYITETKEGAENRTKLTRIGKGIGTGWDKVRLSDGREGYVAQKYVYVYNYVKVENITLSSTDITLEINQKTKLTATITPTNALYQNVTWSSSDTSIVTVDSNGNITAKSSGVAYINATTGDQWKTATCKINVISKVTGITLEKNTYTVVKDNYLEIIPNIEPSNATNKEYTLTSSDESIVKIESNKIKGAKVGTAKVTFTTKDGSNTAIVTINVIELNEENNIKIDSSYRVSQNEIANIEPGTKASEILSKISYNNKNVKVELVDVSGKAYLATSNIGTGSKILVKNATTNDVINTYTIIIYGDINGDGEINTLDILLVKKHVLNMDGLSSLGQKAANIAKDGAVPTTLDILRIKKHVLNLERLPQ